MALTIASDTPRMKGGDTSVDFGWPYGPNMNDGRMMKKTPTVLKINITA